MEHNRSLFPNNISCDVMFAMLHPLSQYIPVLLTLLALHIMEDGWLAAPEAGVSMENMDQQYTKSGIVQYYSTTNASSTMF